MSEERERIRVYDVKSTLFGIPCDMKWTLESIVRCYQNDPEEWALVRPQLEARGWEVDPPMPPPEDPPSVLVPVTPFAERAEGGE